MRSWQAPLILMAGLFVSWSTNAASTGKERPASAYYYDQNGSRAAAAKLFDRGPEPKGGLDAFRRNIYYPPWERSLRLGGDVHVFVSLNAAGKVLETRILESTRQNFNRVVLSAVRGTKWKPATKNGVGVPAKFSFWIRFVPWPKGS